MNRLLLSTLLLVSGISWASPQVVFETTLGSFTVSLDEEKAPVSVANFIKYVNDGSYVGSQFHRVIPGFMAQGGGFDKELKRLPTYAPIQNEASNGLQNNQATIAMARTNDPNSATRQFFINFGNNNFLDYGQRPPGYAVFGKVTQGFDIVQSMATKPTHTLRGMKDVPVKPIIITKATLINE